jgi:hypothetical protein
LHAEVHEALRLVRDMHDTLIAFRPLLSQFIAAPGASMLARRARRGKS